MSEFSQFMQGADLSYTNVNAEEQQTCVSTGTGFNPKKILVTNHGLR